MKDLIIIGAGGFGREILSYALEMENLHNINWKVKGFIDDNLEALDSYNVSKYKIINTIKDYSIKENDVFVCAIAEPKIKLKICENFLSKGAIFVSFIHPEAYIMQRVQCGHGLIMAPYSCIGPDCKIGSFVTINRYSACGHDAVLEKGCTLSSFCDVTGFSNLHEGVFMGSHSSVTPSVKVGKYAKICAGSIVFKNIKDEQTVYGNPAKKLF